MFPFLCDSLRHSSAMICLLAWFFLNFVILERILCVQEFIVETRNFAQCHRKPSSAKLCQALAYLFFVLKI